MDYNKLSDTNNLLPNDSSNFMSCALPGADMFSCPYPMEKDKYASYQCSLDWTGDCDLYTQYADDPVRFLQDTAFLKYFKLDDSSQCKYTCTSVDSMNNPNYEDDANVRVCSYTGTDFAVDSKDSAISPLFALGKCKMQIVPQQIKENDKLLNQLITFYDTHDVVDALCANNTAVANNSQLASYCADKKAPFAYPSSNGTSFSSASTTDKKSSNWSWYERVHFLLTPLIVILSVILLMLLLCYISSSYSSSNSKNSLFSNTKNSRASSSMSKSLHSRFSSRSK
jgi:hypothetical protein